MQNNRPPRDAAPKVTAVLGPTNTGKTYFAIERMLAHKSGMIGLPLRLLAREVYDRIVRLRGAERSRADHRRRKDRSQGAALLCLHRGSHAAGHSGGLPGDRRDPALRRSRARPCLHRPAAACARRRKRPCCWAATPCAASSSTSFPRPGSSPAPRFSDLAYTGAKKLTRLPRRSAVVGFSAEDVYGIAELIRRQRGGAAVVLGALSAPHPQCAGRALSIGRCGFPGGHRRHRHGPEHGCGPCRLRRARQVRRRAACARCAPTRSARSPAAPGAT